MDQLLDQIFAHLRGMWLWRFWGLAVAWLAAAAGLTYAVTKPSQYEASARVYVNTQSVLKPLMVGLAVQPNTDQQVSLLANTLMSRPNLERLAAAVSGGSESEQQRNALIERISQTMALSRPTKDNDLFALTYLDTNPTRAKRTVEELLGIFVESGQRGKQRDTGKAVEFLDQKIAEYEAVLRQAEQRLKDFRLANLEHLNSASDTVGSMLTLDGDIRKARIELRAAEQRRDALRRQLSGEDPVLVSDATGAVAGDPLTEIDSRADALRRNLDELLRKYTDEHPDVLGTRRILKELDEQRAALLAARQKGGAAATVAGGRRMPNPVYQQLKFALADAEAHVASLGSTLGELERRYEQMRDAAKAKPELEEELAQLNRDYQVQKANFEQLVQRREQAKLTDQLDQSGSVDFKVIDPPRVSSAPVAPNRLKLFLAAVAVSLGAGVACCFALNQMFPRISTVKELRAVSETAVLGSVSLWTTPAMMRRRRWNHYAFAAGVAGLCAVYGVAIAVLLTGAQLG